MDCRRQQQVVPLACHHFMRSSNRLCSCGSGRIRLRIWFEWPSVDVSLSLSITGGTRCPALQWKNQQCQYTRKQPAGLLQNPRVSRLNDQGQDDLHSSLFPIHYHIVGICSKCFFDFVFSLGLCCSISRQIIDAESTQLLGDVQENETTA
eukprot:4543777-Amphidinium_carterae.1